MPTETHWRQFAECEPWLISVHKYISVLSGLVNGWHREECRKGVTDKSTESGKIVSREINSFVRESWKIISFSSKKILSEGASWGRTEEHNDMRTKAITWCISPSCGRKIDVAVVGGRSYSSQPPWWRLFSVTRDLEKLIRGNETATWRMTQM